MDSLFQRCTPVLKAGLGLNAEERRECQAALLRKPQKEPQPVPRRVQEVRHKSHPDQSQLPR